MATATAAAVKKPNVKEFNFTWVGTGQGRQDRARGNAGDRRSAGQRHAAPAGHQDRPGQEAAAQSRRQDHREGHHALYAPARDDDEVGRAAAAGIRHRGQGAHQRGRRQAPARHQDRGGNRLEPEAGVREASPLLRRAVLQPGRRGRAGRDTRQPARPSCHLQGKDPRDQEQDQVRAVLPARHHRRRVRDYRGDHDLRDSRLQAGVHELRRGPACPDPDRDGDLGLFRGVLVRDFRRDRSRDLGLLLDVEALP